MRHFFSLLCLVLLLLLPVSGNCGFFSRNKAKLSEPAMTDSVEPETKAPLSISDRFPPNTGTLYATIKLSDASKNTEVGAVFFLLGEEERQIAEDSFVTSGTGYVSFSLDAPPSGWPKSRYKVLFSLNGKAKEELFFTVEDAPAQPVQPDITQDKPAVSVDAQDSDSTYKAFKDQKFGFSFELPNSWQFQVDPGSGDYVFVGPKGTDEAEITIIVQIIDPRLGEMADLKVQMLELVNQIIQVPQAEIVKKNQIDVSGTVAPFFLATYPAQNKKKQTVEFGHTQLGIENKPYLLLISYAAPRDIYQEKVNIFQHMMDTTQLFQPKP